MIARIVPFEGSSQRLLHFEDSISRAAGIIAVDSIVLGPATGGCRLWSYDDDQSMIMDAQRLARGMSYKNAMAGLPLGGGKSVIRRPSGEFDRTALFTALGRTLETLEGDYLVAEDVGTSERDMQIVRSISRHVFGLPARPGVAGGDPSPWTALGVFLSIEALLRKRDIPLAESRVAVQGLGSVGAALSRLLHQGGASLVVADINERSIARLLADIPAQVTAQAEIHRCEVDLFAPCALGGGLNADTIPEIGAGIVAGAANNQLATAFDGIRLHRRKILYAPDYVVNAGGIINVAAEYLSLDQAEVAKRVSQIPPRLLDVLDRAEMEDIAPSEAADTMAQNLLIAGAARAGASFSRSSLAFTNTVR